MLTKNIIGVRYCTYNDFTPIFIIKKIPLLYVFYSDYIQYNQNKKIVKNEKYFTMIRTYLYKHGIDLIFITIYKGVSYEQIFFNITS